MTDTTFKMLKNKIQNDAHMTIHEEIEGNQLILIEGDAVEPGDRIVSIAVDDYGAPDDCEEWFPISANEFHGAHDFGKNEVEWSAVSLDEAIFAAKRAFDHEEFDGQPTID